MALHLVVRIVLVGLEKRKVQKLTLIPDGEGEEVCRLLRSCYFQGTMSSMWTLQNLGFPTIFLTYVIMYWDFPQKWYATDMWPNSALFIS